MRSTALVLACLAVAISASGCASQRQAASQTTGAAVTDAIGMARERPGRIRIDDGDDTVPTPYGGDGARRRCSTIARDTARLTVLLGPDIEEEHYEDIRRDLPGAEPADGEDAEDPSLMDRSREFAADAPDMAADGARDLYHSSIVGLNPIRPVIRFVGRADEIERAARMEQGLAQRRRAYLRGLYDGLGCPPAQMRRAFEAYGLIEEEDADE